MFKSRWEWLKLRSPLYKPWASHVLLHLQTTKTTTNKTCTSLLCFAVFESSHQIHLIIWHQRHLCHAFWWINPGSVESTAQDLKITNTPKQFKTKVWNKRRKIEDVIFDILYHLFLWANPPTKVKQHSALQHFTTLIAALKKKLIFSRLALLQTSINQAWKWQLSTIPSHFPAFAAGSKTGPNWPFNTCTFDHSRSSESSNIHSNQTECSWPGYHSKLSSS